MRMSDALYKAFEQIVGKRNISREPAVLETYRCASAQSSCHYGPYDNRTPTPLAVVMPGSTEEVQKVILLCNEHKIKFKASTTFWSAAGYIGDDNSIQLDMRRMAGLEIDAKNQIAIIEPYAITARVQAEAMKHGLTPAVAGMGCSSSIVASTFGWQGGGPSTISMGNNYDNMLGAEFVMADGKVLRLGSLGGSGDWCCADGPVFSLRAVLRGGGGLAGEMGVCTRLAIKLSPWPGPDHLPTRGLPPAYKAELPDNFKAYTICFPDWLSWAQGYTYFYDNEIVYLGHRQFNCFGRDLKGAMLKILTDPDGQLADLTELLKDDTLRAQTEDMRIDTQIVLAGMTANDLAWKEAALEEILQRVGAHKSEMMLDKEMVDYTLSYLIRLGHKNLNYVMCGAYEGNMAWSSNVFVDAQWMEEVVAMKRKCEEEETCFAAVGGDSGLGSMTRAGGGGSTGFEFFMHFDAHDKDSIRGVRDYIDRTQQWMTEHGFGLDLGRVNQACRRPDGYSFTQAEHDAMFRKAPNRVALEYQWKIREVLNPNRLCGSYYRTVDPDSEK